jgi:hypothetical protein
MSYGSLVLIVAGFYTLVVALVFGWGEFWAHMFALLVVVVLVLPITTFFVLGRITALRVGANDEGFAIVRAGGKSDDFEAFTWDALESGARSSWTPFLGQKYPVRILHAAGLGTTYLALTRAQAELLASFPRGSALQRLLV